MISPQSTECPVNSFPQNTTAQTAQLQAMGIQLFVPLHELDVSQQPWLGGLVELLGINQEDCLFDSSQPFFDDKLKKLHLPKSTILNEFDFKKLIWQSIRQFVN